MSAYYHVAPRPARRDIQRQGLVPDPYSLEEQEPGVYVHHDLQSARRLLREYEKIREEPHDIWEVNPEGSDWQEDPLAFQSSYSREPVPANRLRLMTPEEFALEDYIAAAILPEVRFPFESLAATMHQGAWVDVANKAKRLVAEGRVTILRNAPHHIMAHVIGDGTDNNGTPDEHEVEISRELDPNGMPTSNTIEQWNCTCAWSQYSWNRTRKWKKYEGRPCSHVIATYWKAKSTPLDITEMPEGYQVPRGQKQSPAGPGQMAIPGVHPEQPGTEQRQFEPGEPEETPPGEPQPAAAPPTAVPSNQDLTMPKAPESPFSTPKQQPPQHEQLELFDITAPPGQQTPGAPPIVSVPGGSPPTPGNPVKFPGTFSHFIPVLALHTSQFIYANDSLSEYFDTQRAAGQPIHVALLNSVALERSGGKIPVPGAQPYGVSQEGIPLYNVMELGWNPQTQERENADVNLLQGAPEQTGTYSDVPPGKYAEVLDYEPSLKMAFIVVPLNYPDGVDSRLHPHLLKGWVSYSDLRPVAPKRSPFRRKK